MGSTTFRTTSRALGSVVLGFYGGWGVQRARILWGMGASEHVTSTSRLLIYDAVELMVVCSHDVRA